LFSSEAGVNFAPGTFTKEFTMELEAIVNYGDGRACFKIQKENPGIYHARLLYFEGNKKQSPPKELVLMRGIRYWAGSDENEALLNELGKKIEDVLNDSIVIKAPMTGQ
jgi:hypothetical protein